MLYAVEFQAMIKNGVIEIPPEYREEFRDSVRVILLAEEVVHPTVTLIDQLLAHPLQIKQFQLLSREELYVR